MDEKNNSSEEIQLEVHKLVEIKKENGMKTVHEEETTTKKTKIQTNTDKVLEKNGGESKWLK